MIPFQGSPPEQQQPIHLASRGMPLAPHPPQGHAHPYSQPLHNHPLSHSSQDDSHPLSHSSQIHSHIQPLHSQGHSHPLSHPSQSSYSSPHPPQSPPLRGLTEFSQNENNYPHNSNVIAAETKLEQHKKKKKKSKNKKKLSSESDPDNYPIGPLRGVIAPLEPPDGVQTSPSKLGGIEMVAHRPGPWEHASLGLLRRGSPESPRLGPHGQLMGPDDDERGNELNENNMYIYFLEINY